MRVTTDFRIRDVRVGRFAVGTAVALMWLAGTSIDASARRGGGRNPSHGYRSYGSVRHAPATRAVHAPMVATLPAARPVRQDVHQPIAPVNERYEYRDNSPRNDHRTYPVYGTRVRTLPAQARRATLGGHSYYYWGSAYYIWDEAAEEYECVETPIGALVEELPEGCNPIIINEKEYYLCGSAYYVPGYYEDAVWYKRIARP